MEEYVFPFNDRNVLQYQCDDICQKLYEDLWAQLLSCDDDGDNDASDSQGLLSAEAKQFLSAAKNRHPTLHWLARYAAVVLFPPVGSINSAVVVVGLDDWKKTVHSSVFGRERTALANVRAPAEFELGCVETSKIKKILHDLDAKLRESEANNTGSQRGQRSGHQGNQRTPSFAATILLQVIGESSSHASQSIQGGTTDVSLHTGCIQRNTSFPLVLSAFHAMLRREGAGSDELFNKCVSVYLVTYLKRTALPETDYDATVIDRAITVIREVGQYLLPVQDSDFKDRVLNEIDLCYSRLKSLRINKPCQLVLEPVKDICRALRSPRFPCIPPTGSAKDPSSRLEQARKDAKENLTWSNLDSDVFANLQDARVQLSALNKFFWEIATELDSPVAAHDIATVRRKLDLFCKAVDFAEKESKVSPLEMSVVLLSYKLVAVWVTYCWAHFAAERQHNFFHRYGTALVCSDLRHAVLDDARARTAVDHVRRFLRARENRIARPFNDFSATLDLALDFGSTSVELKNIHHQELQAAEREIRARWREVSRKQEELRRLDRELIDACGKAQQARYQVQHEKSGCYYERNGAYIQTSAYRAAVRERDECEGRVTRLQREIKAIEMSKPPDILFALPRDLDRALQWLFFIYMPQEFQDLAALSHLGMSVLRKTSPKAWCGNQDLCSWFHRHKRAPQANAAAPTCLILWSQTPSPRLNTPGIRQYGRETGTFFPDALSMDPAWRGTDPFQSRSEKESVIHYTEQLPSGHDKVDTIQQFVAMLPTATRENEGIAWQDLRPEWLSKEQFVAYANLRAHPRTQIRSFLDAVADDLLPFEHDCVQVLVKQLMYHVGEEDWLRDVNQAGSGGTHPVIATLMTEQLSLLSNSPQYTERLLIFGIVSAYYGQFDEGCKRCAVEFSRVLRRLGDEVFDEVGNAEHISINVYKKQAKLYGCAILCHFVGNRSDGDLKDLIEHLVLFRNRFLFASDVRELQDLEKASLSVMASRIVDVASLGAKSTTAPGGNLTGWTIVGALGRGKKTSGILTRCLSLIVEDVSPDLVWRAVKYPGVNNTGCFEAVSDRLYSINLLNGTVLVNGAPPGLLPISVTGDPLYQRTFGFRNFEVVVNGVRHFRTRQRVNDRLHYEFVLDSNSQLQIIEHGQPESHGEGLKLQLLPRDALDLPLLLREKFSHWFSEAHDVVVLRGPAYQNRSIEYLITRAATFAVPCKFQGLSLNEILGAREGYSRVLLGEPGPLKIFARFEEQKYIHLTANPESTILNYSFPRFKLAFDQMDTKMECVQFDGFSCATKQHLEDTLPGLTQVLVLQHSGGRRKLLIPDGKVRSGCAISCDNSWNTDTRYHIYDEHARFRTLVAADSVARLHLAALYASNASYLVDRRLGQPAATVAVDLVRQCWKNEPLSSMEQEKLAEVSSHSSLSSTLRLICSWIWKSAYSVEFLFSAKVATSQKRKDKEQDAVFLAAEEYRSCAYHARLRPCEELSLLASRQPVRDIGNLERRSSATQLYVKKVEAKLRSCITSTREATSQSFPLCEPSEIVGFEAKIREELRQSYRIHRQQPKAQVMDPTSLPEAVVDMLNATVDRRRGIETSTLEALFVGNASFEHRLAHFTGSISTPSSLGLVGLLADASLIELFARGLSSTYKGKLRSRAMDWALLSVLEDKLHRIKKILDEGNENDLKSVIAELRCVRDWNPVHHPRWLAFEVEQKLQIRPHQYSVVQQLLKQPGSVVQLNMGLGKTRVLVPMIVLELMSESCLTRLNVLPSIAYEAIEYYRRSLVASVQNVKLFMLPFHRDVPLEECYAERLISDELDRCKEHNGFLVVTPQHRNSLLLKQHDQGIHVSGLRASFKDVLDESDAILHHDFQLVYALGSQVPLPDGTSRWTAFEFFLKVLARDECSAVTDITSDATLVHKESVCSGAFPMMRLLLPFFEGDNEETVRHALSQHLVDHPPHEFRWIGHVQGAGRALLVRIMSDPEADPQTAWNHSGLFQKHKGDILAVRGCLAYSLLFHGLAHRYRVNYGLNEKSGKKLAVPFSASDTPKDRAEYSHPDMAILYTCLSYFSKGLTKSQFRGAVSCLQNLGPSAQREWYCDWVESIRNGTDPLELARFDDISKVDLSNKLQFDLMHERLGRSMDVIQYWLNNFVFPTETYQFPSKRATSAWNLADRESVGFSGTDDNRFLLPLAVKQRPPDTESLRATNGEMIDLILTCTRNEIRVLTEHEDEKLWKTIVRECQSLQTSALIDVAGLMAGSRNAEVARFFASEVGDGEFKGVVYYDTTANSWSVYETENRRSVTLRTSSLSEAECFVYFDESRCRGSDMKLRRDALALVTLEPKMTKDKFLQGCARMRKLGPNAQSLVLAGTSEVVCSDSTVKEVLEKIVENTVSLTRKALPTFYERGSEYHRFPDAIDVDVSLDVLYGSPRRDLVDFCQYLDGSRYMEASDEQTKLVSYCKDIGQGMTVYTSKLFQECERELEQEREEEEEKQVELERNNPYSQSPWDFSRFFGNPESSFVSLFIPLRQFVREKVSQLASIEWSDKLYCTPNFCRTIEKSISRSDLSSFLRHVNPMLVLRDGRVVLISLYELNELLPYWWKATSPKAFLEHLSFCVRSDLAFDDAGGPAISAEVLASIKLFRGHVKFSEEELAVLGGMFRNVPSPRNTIEELLIARSRLAHFDRSDLDGFSFSVDELVD